MQDNANNKGAGRGAPRVRNRRVIASGPSGAQHINHREQFDEELDVYMAKQKPILCVSVITALFLITLHFRDATNRICNPDCIDFIEALLKHSTDNLPPTTLMMLWPEVHTDKKVFH